jgi:hypothetical protein
LHHALPQVAFSREYSIYPNDPLLLAQSLTAKVRCRVQWEGSTSVVPTTAAQAYMAYLETA